MGFLKWSGPILSFVVQVQTLLGGERVVKVRYSGHVPRVTRRRARKEGDHVVNEKRDDRFHEFLR